jgi:bacillaene synthase trans-acting acyltransferase
MFSGQGSQYYRMGEELYENNPRFRLWLNHCDTLVSPLIEESLVDIIYRQGDKGDPLDRILYSNPALLCVEYSLARLLMEMGVQPDCLLGYSLGEFTAAVVSGALNLEDGIELAIEFARLLEAAGEPGGMLAIIESQVIIRRYPALFRNSGVTGTNFDRNFVVSGRADEIERLQRALGELKITTQRLPVNYGFHTALLDPLEDRFKVLAGRLNFNESRIDVVSALHARRIEEPGEDHLWEVVRRPVDFANAIRTMLRSSAPVFIDVGPSGTLATFVKYLLPEDSGAVHMEMINPFGRNLCTIDNLKQQLTGLGLC